MCTKIAVTSTGNSLNSKVSTVFGRCPYFAVVDNGEKCLYLANPAMNEKGAGNMAAQFMVDNEIETLISGKLGPVAFGILKNAGVKIYKIKLKDVETNLRYFREGKLMEITSLSSGFPEVGNKNFGKLNKNF